MPTVFEISLFVLVFINSVIIGIPIGIIDIIIGINFDYRKIRKLADWLIVHGCFTIILSVLVISKLVTDELNISDFVRKPRTDILVVSFINLGIIIWGTYMVYGSNQDTCPSTLYNYGYYRIMVAMFSGVAIFAICFIEKCCCSSDDEKDISTANRADSVV